MTEILRTLFVLRLPHAAFAAMWLAPLLGCGAAPPASLQETQGKTPNSSKIDTAPAPSLRLSEQAAMPTQSSIADLVERVAPTVVSITTTQAFNGREIRHPLEFLFPDGPRQRMPKERSGAGTGFVVDAEGGYLVTNAHVVADADDVKVHFLDGREVSAEVVGSDRTVDLALLRVKAAGALTSVVLGESDTVRVGEQVLAVGNPFGLGHSVSLGIVSAKARTIGAGPYDDFIQTDASINPGNSGGPLFNVRGEVIGINTAIRADAEGIGFAIPVDVLKDVVTQLKEKGFVERGKLGLAFQPITPELATALGMERPRGALVNDVQKGSSAANAGIQSGDVIVAVNGIELKRSEELARNVARHPPGTNVEFTLLRTGHTMIVHATLDKLQERERAKPRTQTTKPESDRMLGLEVDEHAGGGAVVAGLTKPIEGLSEGDVIVEVSGKPVANVAALRSLLEEHKKGSTVLLRVQRGEHTYFVALPID